MDNQSNYSANIGNHYYNKILPVFEQIVYSYSKYVQLKEIMTVMGVQHIKNQRERGINVGSNIASASHGMSLCWENNANLRSARRHKFAYESFGSS